MVLRQDLVQQSYRHSPITIFTRRSFISRSLLHNHSGMVLRQDLLIPTIFTPQSFSMVLRQDLVQQSSRHSPITIFNRRSLHQSFVIPLSLATVLRQDLVFCSTTMLLLVILYPTFFRRFWVGPALSHSFIHFYWSHSLPLVL
jgi:hypothetical protein